MELQNYLTITTPDAMNAIPDQSTPYPLAIGSRQSWHPWERAIYLASRDDRLIAFWRRLAQRMAMRVRAGDARRTM
jgi:hypothetical protein